MQRLNGDPVDRLQSGGSLYGDNWLLIHILTIDRGRKGLYKSDLLSHWEDLRRLSNKTIIELG